MASRIAYPWFFFYRVARIALLVFLPTLFLMLFMYRSSYQEGLVSQMTQQIQENLRTTGHTLKSMAVSWQQWCQHLPPMPDVRYSLVSSEGIIQCDSLTERAGRRLKNLSEVNSALEQGFAWQVRPSDLFGVKAVFAALKLEDGMIIRKVVPITSLRDDLNRFDRVLFLRILPFALAGYLLFILLFFLATRPLGSILAKVEKLKVDLPFNKTLQLLYRRNEWDQIEAALSEADQKFQKEFLKSQEENRKNSAILESIHDNIIAIDNFETVLFFNTNFQQNFQSERNYSKEIIPKIWQIFRHEQILSAFRTVLKSGEVVSLKGLSGLSSLNPGRFHDVTITPLRAESGKVSGALAVFYDITDFKLTEQMRVDFVANVSHEIRTPLTSIKGYAQVLQSQQQKIDSSLHPFLEKIIANTERMISLFNDLLNLSVIESREVLKIESLPLPELVESVAGDVINNYPEKEIKLELALELDTIRGDQRLLEQVLTNLIDNACKYGEQGTSIKISAAEWEGKARLVVADTGPGIPDAHLLRIFERFYRMDASRGSSGTGLGLSIVKHIIAKHGGKIWAESSPAKGSAFIIELPLG
jgi:two-component system, OmpR family, phosphate regulon sensor histidine kinase PhoR